MNDRFADAHEMVPGQREPRHYLVKRHLSRMLSDFRPGVRIPGERELASLVGTSRSTVRQAVAELVTEGFLVKQQGSGTYIAEPKLSWPLQLSGFSEQAVSSGLTVDTTLVSAERLPAAPELADLLQIGAGEPIYRVARVRTVNGTPMALEHSHLSGQRFPGLDSALGRSGSLYGLLQRRWDVKVTGATETIEAAPASVREAKLLSTEVGSLLLLLCRHSFDAEGDPVEWVRSWYRGDRYKLVASLGS
jgi:GntR family transcriptional regulator